MSRPIFIVIEGIDGSGKSTQMEMLHKRFTSDGKASVITHEPTNGVIGSLIRSVLNGEIEMDSSALAALYLADRLDHIKNSRDGMLTRLNDGYHVISSRYYYSSYAFQGEYVSLNWLIAANSLCKSFLKADITFYLNIDPEISLKRLKDSREKLDIFENKEKQIKTHNEFLNAFEITNEGENIVILDGSLTADEIHEEIWKNVIEMTSF